MADEQIKLIYAGEGSFLPGVPARDLTAAEVKQYGSKKLLKSKLYQRLPKPSQPDRPAAS